MDISEIRKKAENEYMRWLDNLRPDDEYYDDLQKLRDNPDECLDSFYSELAFGTSGLRGILGPGTNRINGFVIRRATQGIANYLLKNKEKPSVVVGYDSRKGSVFYARETAAVLNGNGIKAYLFDEIVPVSLLSYGIKALGCDMGIMITASHNPKIYNGYKVYNGRGHQIVGDEPENILKEIEKIDFFSGIKYRNEGINDVPEAVSNEFIKEVLNISTNINSDILNNLETVYTPLNGAGGSFVKKVFNLIGYSNYKVVKSQEFPDSDFKTCPQPNPEKLLAYNEAFGLLDSAGGDIIIATDPDSDRVGVALYHEGVRTLITGNQLGILLLDYLCHIRPPGDNQKVYKSIVTSPLVDRISSKFNLEVVETLTGFKYIGETIASLEDNNSLDEYYFGFEESNGYLAKPFISDKDGVSSAMLALEMAAFHKAFGKDLIDRLGEIYEEYGNYFDKTRNYVFNGAVGKFTMDKIMNHFRKNINESIGGVKIAKKIDYMSDTSLPKSDVIGYILENGCSLFIRPSGTEAKIKIYSYETGDLTSVERDIIKLMEYHKRSTEI
ncbi:MAG: phospho-sugar mutase [Hornefia sp.]|nr:phospho-sugar mutase [Hornefia sp.]